MISAELIYQKASRLESFHLQEVADFIDFLAGKTPPAGERENAPMESTADVTRNLTEELVAIGRHCAASPLLDKRTPDQILGYNSQGLPE